MKSCCARYAIFLSTPVPSIRSQLGARALRFAAPRRKMSSTPIRYTTVPKELPGDEPDDVLFSSLYGVRTIELNRPKKLNSLNGSMARKILPRLREWEKSDMANVILVSGAGPKAFCAGGDVAELAKQNKTGKEGQKTSSDYFGLEYQLDHLIATYSKPYIAIMDGITMGGGVGLSVHAPFRIATEKTVFAMPETTIGFFPDVGGSFFLPRLDGQVGTYLALTSERLQGVQAFYAGIATHYIDSSVLAPLTTRLSELIFKDYATLPERLELVNNTIGEFTSGLPSPDMDSAKTGNLSGELRTTIDKCFRFDSIEEIISALQLETSNPSPLISEWAKKTVKTIGIRSPTSLKVTLHQLRLGRNWNIAETFIREHAMATHFMAHPDFTEGVSARLINKPPTQPNWQPATLNGVSSTDVDVFFTPVQDVDELNLIDPLPSSKTDNQYLDYPHASFALPRENDIKDVVLEKGSEGKKAVINEVLKRWKNKLGVKEKVADVLARKAEEGGNGGIVWIREGRASL